MNIDKIRVRAAWILLIGCIIAWPVSQLTIARSEPPFVLGLSWLAIILTCLDLISTSQVKRDQK